MTKIQGIDGMSADQIQAAVSEGGKFVVFPYVISILIMTFSRNSDIVFVPAGKSPIVKSLPYILLSLVLGWWGFPWGLIRTPIAIITNLAGGKNVTPAVMAHLTPVIAGRAIAAVEFDLGL